MSTHENQITGVHRWPLIGALLVVVLTLVLVTVSVIAKSGDDSSVTAATQLQQRDLLFRDAENGEVIVYDAASQKPIGRFAKGAGAFVRISMRSLMRQRELKQIEPEKPFRLALYSDGNMRIMDPVSGESIRINAFGSVALESFRKILSTGVSSSNHSEQGAKG